MTDSESPPSQLICPRCDSARSKAATFCGVCGQDLRPGAPVVPLPSAPEPVTPDTGKVARRPGRGLLRRKPDTGAPEEAPANAPTGAVPPPPSTRPAGLAPTTRPVAPSPTAAPRPQPAVVPRADENLSFSERYRGTEYSNPDIERYLPPPTGTKGGGRRWGRIIGAGILVVALLAGASAGAWFLFLSPDAVARPTASAPGLAAASSTPRPTPTPQPTINGQVPDEAEVAACLLLAEDAEEAADLAAIRADVAADRTGDLVERTDAVSRAIERSMSSLPALEAVEATQPLATAWRALFETEREAVTKLAASRDDAGAIKTATKRLDEAAAAREAVATAHAELVATYPEATCVVLP